MLATVQGASAEDSSPPVTIDIVESDAGEWTVTYNFVEPQRALVLSQAPVVYREWQPLNDGVSMWRIGKMEGFVFDEPGTSATFRFTPHTGNLPAAYTPFLPFSDGSFGVLTGQFRVKPLDDLDEAASFDGTGQDWAEPVLESSVSLRSPRRDGVYIDQPSGLDGTYVYIGSSEPIEGANFAGYVDDGLPTWLAESFDSDLGVIFSELAGGWGIELAERARILMVFRGYETDGLTLGGGAIGRLLSLEMGGADLREPIPEIRTYVRWFLAHEAAHIFQQERGNIRALFAGEGGAWVHEGSANTFSHNIGAKLADDPETFLFEVYGEAYRDCLSHLEDAPLSRASEMQNFRASYACGDLIALATDAALPDHNLYDVWRAMQAASEDADERDRVSLYFMVLRELGATETDIAILRQFATEQPEDAQRFLVDTMAHFGLPLTLDGENQFVSLQVRSEADMVALFD